MTLEDRPYLREIQLNRDDIENFEDYPFCIPAVKKMESLEFHPEVIFGVGENGTGKSTLVEAIAVATGSGGTHAGLQLGKLLNKSDIEIISINVCDDAEFFRNRIYDIIKSGRTC